MKTSYKYLLAAAILIMSSLSVYDLLVRAEYRSENYTDPFRNFVTLNFKDFDILDIPSSTAANVKIVQGPFSIRLDKYEADFVQVNQEGKRLRIKAHFDGNYQSTSSPYILLISCPKLSEVYINAEYTANNASVTDTIVREDWNMRQVLIDGFNQDSMYISQDYGSTIVLANNNIRSISATVGKSRGSGSYLIIQNNNEFNHADLDIQDNSKLFLDNAKIQNLNYQLGDSAKLIVTGKAKNLLNNTKSEEK
jgi:hypothetical protein